MGRDEKFHQHGQFFLMNYKNNLLQIGEFKFEGLKFQVLFSKLCEVLQTDYVHVNTNFVRCLRQFLNL